jgi:hypothetical protein
MRVRDWMITLGLAVISSGAIALMKWGGAEYTSANHEGRITKLESWKDTAVEKLGGMDAKLDLLLQANGVEYQPRRIGGHHESNEGAVDRRSIDDAVRHP